MNKIVKNASWIIGCRIIQAVMNLVVSMITARYLGPSNYGIITYAASIVAFIVPLVQLGVNGVLVQEFVDYPDNSGEIIGTVTFLTMLSSLLGIVGIGAFTSVVNRNEPEVIVVSVLYSLSLVFQMMEMIQYWYQAKLMSKFVSVVSLVSRLVVSVYKVYIIIAGKNIYWFAIVNSLDYLLISVSLYIIYAKIGQQKWRISFGTAKRIFSKSRHFIVAGMMVSVFAQTDKIMLKLMINDSASGFYSAAITCAGMSVFLFTAVIDSFRPVIFEYKKKNQEKYRQYNVLLYSIIIYAALLQSVALTVLAKPIVNLLYGNQFLPTASILQIVTWYSAFSYLGAARTIWFLSEGKQKYIWITNLMGAIVNVVGNLILIPLYGACGAALTSVVTQFMTNFALTIIIKPIRENGILMIKAVNPKVWYSLIRKVKKGRG